MKVRFTLALAFTSMGANAETDMFDMALQGEFYKDYCELAVLSDTRYTRLEASDVISGGVIASFNLPPPPPPPISPPPVRVAGQGGYRIQSTRFELSCSEADYDVDMRTDMPLEYVDEGNNVRYETNLVMYQELNALVVDGTPLSSSSGFSGTLSVSPVQPAEFLVESFLYVIDGNFNNLPDTYAHSVNVIFTIERQ